jgi:hypothetical protein
MSSAAPVDRIPRGKIYPSLTAGEPVGRPLAEWAYLTPSHPKGIKGTDLKIADAAVQRETLLVWFLQNYIPETGPVFGFAEAAHPPRPAAGTLNSAPLNTIAPNGSLPGGSPRTSSRPDGARGFGANFGSDWGGARVAGFGHAPFSSGSPAIDLLKAEFSNLVVDTTLATVSGVLPGLWVPKPEDSSLDGYRSLAELSSALSAILDEIDRLVGALPLKPTGRDHNRSPLGLVELEGLPDEFLPVTANERETVLRATADVRLALTSEDRSALFIAWQEALPALKKIGEFVTSQVRMLYADGPAATTLRTGTAGLAISLIAMELNLINQTGAASIIVAAIGVKLLSRSS